MLETALEVMKQSLISDERIEIRGFWVIEIQRRAVKPTLLNGKLTRGERKRWVIKPSVGWGEG